MANEYSATAAKRRKLNETVSQTQYALIYNSGKVKIVLEKFYI